MPESALPRPTPVSLAARLRAELNANLVAGACSGIATTALLHPFDCVKTRFQVHEGRSTQTRISPSLWLPLWLPLSSCTLRTPLIAAAYS